MCLYVCTRLCVHTGVCVYVSKGESPFRFVQVWLEEKGKGAGKGEGRGRGGEGKGRREKEGGKERRREERERNRERGRKGKEGRRKGGKEGSVTLHRTASNTSFNHCFCLLGFEIKGSTVKIVRFRSYSN